MNILELSRAASTKLTSASGNSSGTGFLVGDQYVVTCFHVAASLVVQGTNVNWTIFPDLQVTLSTGETISGVVVSIPSETNPNPIH